VPGAILYFDPEGPPAGSSSLIASLDEKAEADPNFSFIVRYRPSPSRLNRPKSKLAGYGVELALKKTDYLVVDDRNTGSSATSDSQDLTSNATLATSSFEELLGADPWAELAIPLTKSEVMGESTSVIQSLIGRSRTESICSHHVCLATSGCVERIVSGLPKILGRPISPSCHSGCDRSQSRSNGSPGCGSSCNLHQWKELQSS
jgi:hypothetical protein